MLWTDQVQINLNTKKLFLDTIMIKTAEFVSPKHPDKICDFIADSILDAYLKDDKESRVAIEVMGGHKLISINGEVNSCDIWHNITLGATRNAHR